MAMTTNGHNGHRRMLSEINVTPLVDVMLVLLIIFMITAPLMQQGLDVNLPQVQAPSMEQSKQDLIVTIKGDGMVYLGDTQIPEGDLITKLAAIFEQKEKKDLFIKADGNVRYGEVVKVMAAAKSAGVARIGMMTQPPNPKEP